MIMTVIGTLALDEAPVHQDGERSTPGSWCQLGRSRFPPPYRPHDELRAVDEDLRVVLMLQRRVHQACDVQERASLVAV